MKLIAIHGKAGTGKDTVAKMAAEYIGEPVARIAFADPVRQLAGALVPAEILTSRETKEEPLPKGVASMLRDARYVGTRLAPIFISIFHPRASERPLAIDWNEVIPWLGHAGARNGSLTWADALESLASTISAAAWFEHLSPRRLMQLIGTEWGREKVGVNIWPMVAHDTLRALDGHVNAAIITDVRHQNEAKFADWIGADVWSVRGKESTVKGAAEGHASEAGVTLARGHIVINNTGTLDDLRSVVEDAIESKP